MEISDKLHSPGLTPSPLCIDCMSGPKIRSGRGTCFCRELNPVFESVESYLDCLTPRPYEDLMKTSVEKSKLEDFEQSRS